jgi:TDG/mug DNA glycosylase family protein
MAGPTINAPYSASEIAALRLPDIIAPGLDLLFVGFNPSVISAVRGHFYARPGNQFWPLLALSGLTPRRYLPEEDRTLLALGIGITDLCPIPTPGIADVPRAVAEAGRETLIMKIEQHAPRVVSFNGKATFERFFGRPPAGWGQQEARIGDAPSLVFVTPSSSGRANGVMAVRTAAYLTLGEMVRNGRAHGWGATDAGILTESSVVGLQSGVSGAGE